MLGQTESMSTERQVMGLDEFKEAFMIWQFSFILFLQLRRGAGLLAGCVHGFLHDSVSFWLFLDEWILSIHPSIHPPG